MPMITPEDNIRIFIKDLLSKEVLEDSDLLIVEDTQNTKKTTLRNLIKSMVSDSDSPTDYKIYSSQKIQELLTTMNEYINSNISNVNGMVEKLDREKETKEAVKALEKTLMEIIESKADDSDILEMLDGKMGKNHKIRSSELDTSADEYKIQLVNLSEDVLDAMIGGTPIPTNRAPKGGWVTEDIADGAIVFNKYAEDFQYGGHFIEGDIDNFVKEGIYTLGAKVIGLPKEIEEDEKEVRILIVKRPGPNYVMQEVRYTNDVRYRPVYRRTANINRIQVTDFIKVEEINDKFKVHRDILSDDFSNCGSLSNCDLFTITKEGHYIAEESVSNLPTREGIYEVDIRAYGDRLLYEAAQIGVSSCNIFISMQYKTAGENPVNTQWYNISTYSRSKFENKTVHLFGDGILYGFGASNMGTKSIPSLLRDKYGMRIVNNALGDATAGGYDNNDLKDRCVLTQVETTPLGDADYAVIMVGTNDYKCAISQMGTTQSLNDTTFMGSLNLIIKTFAEKNPLCKLLLVSPIYRARFRAGDNHNGDDYAINDYKLFEFVNAMKEIATYNHIPFVDLYYECGINKWNYTAYLKDGLYLNDEGHEMISTKIFDALSRFY